MLFFLPQTQDESYFSKPIKGEKQLPKSLFAQNEELFQEIGQGPFALNWAPPQMQLPDLRNEILFIGKNLRPDSPGASFRISLKGSGENKTVEENKRIYLVYKREFSPLSPEAKEPTFLSPRPIWGDPSSENGGYVFSPENLPTPLWIELRGQENNAEVKVHMLDEKAALVTAPSELHSFFIHCQNHPKQLGWELGGYRVDTTLLVRQKARWLGPDRFLEMHGGDDYAFTVGSERIDFLNQDHPYCCFVKQNDFLVWKKDHWEVAGGGEVTQDLPLMVVKKIDDKIMSLELWDPEGSLKTMLSLIRAKDRDGIPNLAQEFKFVGAKTWAQFIVECKRSGRLTLKPHDWLVLTQDGWKKLESSEDVDDYVAQRLTGPLFVLEKLSKENGRQILIGNLFNASRTHVEQVELEASPNTSLANYYRSTPLIPPLPTIQIIEEGSEE